MAEKRRARGSCGFDSQPNLWKKGSGWIRDDPKKNEDGIQDANPNHDLEVSSEEPIGHASNPS